MRIPFEPLWKQYGRIIKDHGAIVLFSVQPFTTDLINSNRKLYRYELVWEKSIKAGYLDAKRKFLKCHENIEVFYRHQPTYNPQKYKVDVPDMGRVRASRKDKSAIYGKLRTGAYVEDGTRYPGDVLHFSNHNGAVFGRTKNVVKHPTQKPIELLEYLIRTYTNEGDLVLDNAMGSGSTGIASLNLGRNFIGMELNDNFFKTSCDWMEETHNGCVRVIEKCKSS